MTFILISGSEHVGKTSVCNRLHDLIIADKSFTMYGDKQYMKGSAKTDFIAHYEKNQKHIVLNSPSDGDRCMTDLSKYLDDLAQNGVRPDIIITTIRENNNNGYLLSKMFATLDVFASGTTNFLNYYNQKIAGITSFAPTSLTCHAFVLHLEEQLLSGNKEEQDKALALYWDYNADTAKQMLDLAVDRL